MDLYKQMVDTREIELPQSFHEFSRAFLENEITIFNLLLYIIRENNKTENS